MVSSTGKSQTQPQKMTWLIRTAWIFFILMTLLLSAYALTPAIARYFVINKLEQQGMTEVHFSKVGWEPWAPSLHFNKLAWTTKEREKVNIDHALVTISWSALLDRHILITEFAIEGLKLPVAITPDLQIGGLSIPKGSSTTEEQIISEENGSPWDITVKSLKVTGTDFKLSGIPTPPVLIEQTHNFSIDQLTISDFSTLKPQSKAQIQFKGALDDLGFKLNTHAALLSDAQSIDGSLTVFPMGPFAQAKHWLNADLLAGINGDGILEFELNLDHKNTQSGRVIAFNLNLKAPELQTQTARLLKMPVNLDLANLSLDITANIELGKSTFKIDANSQLQAEKGIIKTENGIEAQLGGIDIKTKIIDTQGRLTALEQVQSNVETEINLKSFNSSTQSINPLIEFYNLQTKVSLNSKTVQVPELTIENLYALRDDKPLLRKASLDNLSLGRNELGEKALQISNMTLDQLQAGIDIDQDGNLEVLQRLAQLQKEIGMLTAEPESIEPEEVTADMAEADSETQTEPASASPRRSLEWLIENFQLTGDNSIFINDKRPNYNLNHSIKIKTFEAQSLSLSQPSQLEISATLNDDGVIKSKGTITLADLQANTDLTTEVENLSLTSLSPYIAPLLGYRINSGTLNSNIKMLSQAGFGKSNMHIEIQKLDMEPANQNVIASLSKELTMPLDLSLSLLKDKHDAIILDVPVELDKTGVNTKIAPVIRQALIKATKNASMTYLKLALQPYGSIVMLAEKSGDLMKEMQLVNIPFDSMSANIGPNQSQPAEKLVTLLQGNSDINIRLCPIATYAEASSLPSVSETEKAKALETLAKQRAQSLKEFFTGQSITSQRLITCAPEIKKSGKGEVKVSL